MGGQALTPPRSFHDSSRPGVVAEFAFLRDGVERPHQFAGAGIEGADVSGRSSRFAVRGKRTADHEVLVDGGRRSHAVCLRGNLSATPVRKLTKPPVPKRSTGLPVRRVDRRTGAAVERAEKDALFLAVRPVRRAAVDEQVVRNIAAEMGIEAHNSLPVSGSSAITRVNGVVRYMTPSTTSGVVSKALREVGRAVADVAGVIGPGDLKLPDVGAVDLVERGVFRAAGIAAVVRPFLREAARVA